MTCWYDNNFNCEKPNVCTSALSVYLLKAPKFNSLKKYFPFIILLVTSCHHSIESKPSKTDCDKFRKGRFYHRAEGDPTLYRIERSDSIQTEFIGKTGDYANLKIEWTGPCSYELKLLNQNINITDSVSEADKSRKVSVEILRVENDTCFIISDDGRFPLHGVVYIDKK